MDPPHAMRGLFLSVGGLDGEGPVEALADGPEPCSVVSVTGDVVEYTDLVLPIGNRRDFAFRAP